MMLKLNSFEGEAPDLPKPPVDIYQLRRDIAVYGKIEDWNAGDDILVDYEALKDEDVEGRERLSRDMRNLYATLLARRAEEI